MASHDEAKQREISDRLVRLEQQMKELLEKLDEAVQKFQGFLTAKQN